MKKSVILLVLLSILLVVVSGCVKNPGLRDTTSAVDEEELDLLQEIEEIERQLQEADGEVETEEEASTEEEATEEVEDTSGLQQLRVAETDLVKLQLSATDADNDDLSFDYSSPLDDNGEWQTDYGDAGEYVVTVTASDGLKESKQKILLVVDKTNVPPQLSGLEDLVVNELDLVMLDLQVIDLNGDQVILTYSEPLDENGVWQTDFTSAGVYQVLVSASDGESITEKQITLRVSDVNQPPVLSGFETELTVNEGELVEVLPLVEDFDGDQVTLTISEPLAEDGTWQTSFTDHGEYVVRVSASDGKDTVTEEILLTVLDVNQAPEIIEITLG